jgi:hypothetical protein
MPRSVPGMLTETFHFCPRLTPDGSIIINELCRCGALKTEHDGGRFGDLTRGHGACKRTKCPKFTWVLTVKLRADPVKNALAVKPERPPGRRNLAFERAMAKKQTKAAKK